MAGAAEPTVSCQVQFPGQKWLLVEAEVAVGLSSGHLVRAVVLGAEAGRPALLFRQPS